MSAEQAAAADQSADARGRVLIHRKAVRIKAQPSKEVPRHFARHLQFVADELVAGRVPPDWQVLRERPPYRKVKLPPLRAMARSVDGSLMVFLIRERDDFYKRINRVRVTFEAGDFTELEPLRARTQLVTQPALEAPRAATGPAPAACWPAFSDEELCAIVGADAALVARLRSVSTAGDAFADDVVAAIGEPHALLLVDMAERPDRYRRILDAGRTPTPLDVEDSDEELAAAVAAGLASGDIVAVKEPSELERLLSGDLEEWMIFLEPKQRGMVEARYNGPARLSGGPGTGKSVVALHRAIELARRAAPGGRVLLATYVSTLPRQWTALLRRIDPVAAARIDVFSVDSLVHKWLPHEVRQLDVLKDRARSDWAKTVLRTTSELPLIGAFGNDPDALIDEFEHVLAASMVPGSDGAEPHPLARAADYGSLERRFRRARTDDEVRAVWDCFEQYRRDLEKSGQTDFALRRLAALPQAKPTYHGVVVDEAQDLSSVALRFLWQLDASAGHSGFLVVADGRQSIYPGGYSLRALGIETRGRAEKLRRNWRTTTRIQSAAEAVVAGAVYDDRDGNATTRGQGDEKTVPLRDGVRPEAHACRHRWAEEKLVAEIVLDRLTAGRRPRDIAVLAPTRKRVRELIAALSSAPIPIAAVDLQDLDPSVQDRVVVGTFHRAKGLEFVEVIVAGLGDASWPPRHSRHPITDPDDRGLHQRALFVAMTRARDHLMLTGVQPLAPEVEALAPIHVDVMVHA